MRAGVLGADDGIVSVAGIVIGVAGATTSRGVLFTAGLAGLVAGAVSMSLGEYVSVSSQRDSENAQLAQERRELAQTPEQELAELANPVQAAAASARSFILGALLPLLAILLPRPPGGSRLPSCRCSSRWR